MPRTPRYVAGLAGVAAVLALAPTASAAPTFTVTTTADSPAATPCTPSACTLRSAVQQANQPGNAGATIIVAANAAPYTLTTADGGELTVNEPMTIEGAGPQSTVIHGDGADRVMLITLTAAGTVNLSGLEITAGIDHGGEGGGIDSTSTAPGVHVDLTNVDVVDNGADGAAAPAGSGGDGSFAEGGGIAFFGGASLTVTNSVIEGNSTLGGAGAGSTTANAGNGGYSDAAGIYYGASGALTISASTITDNEARGGPGAGSTGHAPGAGGDAEAGGLDTGSTGDVTITDSSISTNHVVAGDGGPGTGQPGGAGGGAFGGGLLGGSASLVLTGDTISANTAVAAAGGSGTVTGPGGDARGAGAYFGAATAVAASTISANVLVSGGGNSDASGGGVAINGGMSVPITIVNSTITANTANGPSGSSAHGYGGGLEAPSPVILASDTIDANQAPAGLGGNVATTATVRAQNTIIADGIAAAGSQNCSGTVSDLAPGHNLEDSGSASQCGISTAAGDVLVAPGTSGVAASLAGNGGLTETLALAPASPARGTGAACTDPSLSGSPRLATDQRGEPRGSICDIGAFQIQLPVNTAPPTIAGGPASGSTVTCGDGTWTGDGTLAYTLQWLRDGAPIPGATAAGYPIAAGDAGHQLACAVTAGSAYGSATAISPAITATTILTPSRPPLTPTVSGLRQSAKRWREAKRAATTARRSKTATGTTFTFTLNEAAKVTMPFDRWLPGRRAGRRCVAPTKRNRRDHACTRLIDEGQISLNARRGVNHVSFYGQLSRRHLLTPGHYTMALAATAAGRTSTPRRISFTIVR